MNFKRYHVSRNLFDYNAYFDSVFTPYNVFFNYAEIQLQPNTTYTLSTSIKEIGDNPRNTAFIVATSNETPTTASGGISNVSPITKTTASDGILKLYKRISGTGVIPTKGLFDAGDWLMLNTGSQPLPYEPYSPEVWHDIPHYIHNTSTDTITTLPAVVYPNDTTATVGLKGNMEQASGASPTTPIQPQETGERTGNLFDEIYPDIDVSAYVRYKPIYVGDGTFTLSTTTPYDKSLANIFLLSGNVSGGASTDNNGAWYNHSVTKQSANGYVTIGYRNYSGTTSPADCQTMLNTGSTPLPYEPYGYKIPILSNSTTTNVYLGEMETTRRIRKLVFDGTENWKESSDTNIYIALSPNQSVAWTHVLSTHFTPSQVQTNGGLLWFVNANVDFDTVEECKFYLAQQYAAGTPVTVWYVLETEETGIVNEPIRKIGDYADTVSGITIPTIAGANTLSVDTTLQPSEVTATYKGWHPVQSVHEAENGQWD